MAEPGAGPLGAIRTAPRWLGSRRQALDWALIVVASAVLLGALAGLPLFGDGAYYFLKLALDGELLIPNLRYSAVLAQWPVLALRPFTGEAVTTLRHAFALGYAGLPLLSLAACWLIARRTAPGLMLFPLLSLLGCQLNFSAVSELMLGLWAVWPFVLLAAVRPAAAATRRYGLVLAPLLLGLHPLTFVPLGLLGLLALLAARRPQACGWGLLAAVFAAAAVLRLGWTLAASNAYERAHLAAADAAVAYLLPPTLAQTLLLAGAALLGLLAALPAVRAGAGAGRMHRRLLSLGGWGLLALAVTIAFGFVAGRGIELKAGASFVLGLWLMGLALAAARARPRADVGAPLLVAAAITLLVLAKTAAWWTATHHLAGLTASTEADCLRFGPERPYALQWPWMAIIDDWAAPLNALVFRGPFPSALLLPGDGCERLAETGRVHFERWIERPFDAVEARFGPLRRP